MNKKLTITIITLFVLFPAALQAQLLLGQYEDEAPLRSWNLLGPQTGSIAGMGSVRFTNTSDNAAALTNPALINKLPQLTLTFNSSIQSVELFRFGFVNTGLLMSEEKFSLKTYALDFSGISLKYKSWGIALSLSLLENYNRPQVESNYYYQNRLYETIKFSQTGSLFNYNLSFSKQINSWLSAGVGLNFVKGSAEKDWEDKEFFSDITISDHKSHNIEGFYINGGLVFDINQNLILATIFRSPYTRKADSESLLRNYTPTGNTDISIEISDKSSFKQPLILGAGIRYKVSNPFIMAMDVSFFNWANYNVDYFGEKLDRDFKNTVKINAGLEYSSSATMFNQDFKIPLRAGFSCDPQPIKQPSSRYYYLYTGLGIHIKHFFLDLAGSFGFENGSGNKLKTQTFILTLGYK